MSDFDLHRFEPGEEGEPGEPGEPGEGGGGAGGKGGKGGRGGSSSRWMRSRGLVGYLLLLTVTLLALQLHHLREEHKFRAIQAVSCESGRQIVENQRLVLMNLISLREAALASPYLNLEASRELPLLHRALAAVPKGKPCGLY